MLADRVRMSIGRTTPLPLSYYPYTTPTIIDSFETGLWWYKMGTAEIVTSPKVDGSRSLKMWVDENSDEAIIANEGLPDIPLVKPKLGERSSFHVHITQGDANFTVELGNIKVLLGEGTGAFPTTVSQDSTVIIRDDTSSVSFRTNSFVKVTIDVTPNGDFALYKNDIPVLEGVLPYPYINPENLAFSLLLPSKKDNYNTVYLDYITLDGVWK